MSVIKAEGWDGVTAPALPSDWVFASGYQTETTHHISAPNGLTCTTVGIKLGYWIPPLANDGELQTSAWFFDITSAFGLTCAVFTRVKAYSVSYTGLTAYGTRLTFNTSGGGQLILDKFVSGSNSPLGSLTISSLSTTDKYWVQCIANGGVIRARCQRASDGKYVDGTGAWSSTFGDAIINTDFIITGSGGCAVQVNPTIGGADFGYVDDLLFEGTTIGSLRRRCFTAFM